jgi:spore coat protein H
MRGIVWRAGVFSLAGSFVSSMQSSLMIGLVLALGAAQAAFGAEAAAAPKVARPVPALDVFAEGKIPRVRLELSEAAVEQLRKSPRRYVSGAVVEGERRYTNVAIRLKGGPGSFRQFDDRPAFTINFDKFAPGQTFHGLKKLHLNNSVQDSSLLAEKLCREMFEAAGVPAPRAGHAFVSINDRRMGLYVLIEGVNKQFLKRYFAEAGGNVYDGHSGNDVNQRMRTNAGDAPKDQSRLAALAAAVRLPNLKERRAALERTLDVERFISFMAVEVITSHWDGYSLGRNNFRIFHDMTTDRMVFLPQGLDQTFQRKEIAAVPGMNGLVAKAVLEVPEFKARFRAREAELLTNTFQSELWVKRLREVAANVKRELADASGSTAEDYVKRAAAYRRRMQQRFAALRTELEL